MPQPVSELGNNWPVYPTSTYTQFSGGSRRGGGGRNRHPPPPQKKKKKKLDQLGFLIQVLIGMLKNKAQNAQESIKTTLELQGPLKGPGPQPKVSSVPCSCS